MTGTHRDVPFTDLYWCSVMDLLTSHHPNNTTSSTMKLFVASPLYAVCRFPADASPDPFWETSPFFTVSKTSEELSVVCVADLVPTDGVPKVERGWRCLKVQGPLDFALTGILASLASPLASAGVSIFAISTFDTDYLLIKDEQLATAANVLRREGHIVIVSNRPRDNPALLFQPDPMVAPLVEKDRTFDETFGLVVVAGWPPCEDMRSPYNQFMESVRSCFDDVDLEGDRAPAYLYPFEHLHVTIATLRSMHQETDIAIRDILSEHAKRILQVASSSPEWPKEPLRLTIDHAQIGSRAGILLWNEETEGMDAMRQCIERATKEHISVLLESQKSIREALSTLAIPSIVHSTFLRFYKEPSTPGETIQKKFAERVVSNLQDLIPLTITCDCATLVNERTPYMHIPDDDQHVLYRASLR